MTTAERFIAALATIGYKIEAADMPKIDAFIESTDTKLVDAALALVEKDFPRTSVEERMAEGPIVDFLKNAAPDIETNLDSTLEGFFTGLEATLKADSAPSDVPSAPSSA